MNEKKKIGTQIADIKKLQPLVVTFKGKERVINHFQYDTVERFNKVLESASGGQKMGERHKLQTQMLAIILSDVQGSSRVFRGLRQWLWEKKLSHTSYNEVEALRLIETAVLRIQQHKVLEMHTALILAQMQALINHINGIRKEANNE